VEMVRLGDPDLSLKGQAEVFADEEAAQEWFSENDVEGSPSIDKIRDRPILYAAALEVHGDSFDFSGFDVVLMFECLYYLSPEDQARVLSKMRTPLIISALIIGAS
jgi:hypothetical protein